MCVRGRPLPRGSSPLSRGIPLSVGCNAVRDRIIPALAGNTSNGTTPQCCSQDHPRSRGEYTSMARAGRLMLGSSPLSRGIRFGLLGEFIGNRIIPALAGNTLQILLGNRFQGDHPRSRGEYYTSLYMRSGDLGSSPLSRGILRRGGLMLPARRIIPALAGNTRGRHPRDGDHPDHPRSRGEYYWLTLWLLRASGSSPLSRGIHLLTRDFISSICQILGTPSSHVSASRSRSSHVDDGRHPDAASRLAHRLLGLGGPSE